MCNNKTENDRLKVTVTTQDNDCVMLGSKAPKFSADSTIGELSLDNYLGKWLILFSHPNRIYPNLYNRIYSIC